MTMSDDLSRVVNLMVRSMVQQGECIRLRYAGFGLDNSASKLAKMCGTTPETVDAWEKGILQPTTTEALRWMDCLWQSQPAPRQRVT